MPEYSSRRQALIVLLALTAMFVPTSRPAYSQVPDTSFSLPIPISQEPLMFRIRRGNAFTDDERRWEIAHTEENVRLIAETGERMLYTHFYKGYGFDAEREEMDMAVRVAGWARKYGMVSGVYMQWGTVVLETLLSEDKRAADWVLRDRDGHPVRIAYGQYYWRFLPDIRNSDYLDWFKEKILRYCIGNVKPKYIFLDNVAENPPVSWQPLDSPRWVEGFRDYLRTRYTPAERKAMIGYSDVDHIQPPYWEWENATVINDPVMQRWIDFRCESVTEAVRDVRAFINRLDPTVAVGVNIHGISRKNRAVEGIDPVAVCDGTGVDAWSGEIWVEAELRPNGELVSPIREYKACRTLGVAFMSGGRRGLGEAVKWAFANHRPIPGGGWLGPPGRASHLNGPAPGDRFHRYAEYFRETESVADVAVLRSYPSLAYNSVGPLVETVGFEQALIQARVPFDIIFEKNLADLSKYRVLVLANMECMSDEQVETVRKYVLNGGGLVVTGSSSLYNQWRRPRPVFGLGDVLGLSEQDARRTLSAYRVSDGVWTHVGASGVGPRRDGFGRGRTAYFPRVVPEEKESYAGMHLPVNHVELVEAVKWASGVDLPVRVDAPNTVVMNLCEKKKDRRMFLHLVNFRQDRLENLAVDLRVPGRVRTVRMLGTDTDGETPVEFTQEGDRLRFNAPSLELYDLFVIQM